MEFAQDRVAASSNIGYLNLTSLISGIYTEASDARETVISQVS